MDAVTAVSGSGPAYFALLAEAMIEAGILLGLSREISTQLVVQTMLGTAKQLRDTHTHPVELREMVTSPGGTTIAAIRVLEMAGVRAAFLNAIQAAMDRSKELAARRPAVSDVEIEVLDDPAGELARLLVEAVRAGQSIGLSGGSTPRRAYELAATQVPDWSPRRALARRRPLRAARPTSARTPASSARRSSTGSSGAPRAVHLIQGELEPEEAAARYDAELDGVRFDVAVMGVGPDGHTASLFPGGPELAERERRAVAAEAGMEPFVPRVTTTIPFLAETGLMVFVITGADKADAVRRAFAEEPSEDAPASLVRGRRTVVLLDAGAASGLHS